MYEEYYQAEGDALEDREIPSTLTAAAKDSFLFGAHASKDAVTSYAWTQGQDVSSIMSYYSISGSTEEQQLKDMHQDGYDWYASHPDSSLPPRPPR